MRGSIAPLQLEIEIPEWDFERAVIIVNVKSVGILSLAFNSDLSAA